MVLYASFSPTCPEAPGTSAYLAQHPTQLRAQNLLSSVFLTLKIQRRPASVSQDSLYRAQQEGASSQVMVLTSLKKLKTGPQTGAVFPAGMLLPLPQLVSAPAQWTPSPLPSSENHSIDSDHNPPHCLLTLSL